MIDLDGRDLDAVALIDHARSDIGGGEGDAGRRVALVVDPDPDVL
jgi:hypothetical protein